MHKGVILLTQADDRVEAYSDAESFLEQYGDGYVWDWWALGNRWNNELAPKDKLDEFTHWIKEEYKSVFKDFGYATNDLENEKDRKIIQDKWESMGLIGKNPYYDAYGFSINSGPESEDYNIVPLKDCLDTVKEWCKDIPREVDKAWNSMLKERDANTNSTMSAYYAGIYKDLMYGDFSFEVNVFDIDYYLAEKIPEDVEGWWAVMIDMHN